MGIDPIFSSLWEAALSEIQNDTLLWEVYADTPNFHSDAPRELRADAAEAVLRRLRDEGWVNFVRRPHGLPDNSPGAVLSDTEIEQVFSAARRWYSDASERHAPDDLNVRLAPTQKWLDWAETAYR